MKRPSSEYVTIGVKLRREEGERIRSLAKEMGLTTGGLFRLGIDTLAPRKVFPYNPVTKARKLHRGL